MILTKTPVRISLLGGSSDYPTWLNEGNEGLVVGGTINKYSYISVRYLPPFFPYKTYVSYSEIEKVNSNSEIKHKVIRGVLAHLGIKDGIEIDHKADLPSKTGTGSSSTFIVGLLNGLKRLLGYRLNEYELAEAAINLEQHVLRENVGLQDSVWAAYGGINIIRFYPDYKFQVTKLPLSQLDIGRLADHFILMYTGISRTSSDVVGTYVSNLGHKKDYQKELYRIACEGMFAINGKEYDKVGKLLHENWLLKRSLSESVTSPEIDNMYDFALKNGAVGGKLCGGGGGGSFLFAIQPAMRSHFVKKFTGEFPHSVHIPFTFTGEGSKVIL